MKNTPESIFRKMDAVHKGAYSMQTPAESHEATVREAVYIPKATRDGTYRQLMRSHDRMGTRHLQ